MDNVYCISLQKHKSEWSSILENIKSAGFVNPRIFEAVNGGDLSEETKKDITTPWTYYFLRNKLPRKYHAQPTSWGAIGCSLSHISLWEMLAQSTNEYMIIFEDDIKFNDNFDFSSIVFPDSFDLFFLDILWEERRGMDNETGDYRRIESPFFGMHSYIISRKCAEKLLNYVMPIEVQIDSFVHIMTSRLGLDVFVTNESVCGQKTHASSIQTSHCVNCYPYIVGYQSYFILFVVVILIIGIIYKIYRSKMKNKE